MLPCQLQHFEGNYTDSRGENFVLPYIFRQFAKDVVFAIFWNCFTFQVVQYTNCHQCFTADACPKTGHES